MQSKPITPNEKRGTEAPRPAVLLDMS